MKPIGDLLRDQFERLPALPDPNPERSLVPVSPLLAALGNTLPQDTANELVNALSQYAASGEFADAVNQEVPPPKPDESEDEFVRRAKDAIRKQLMDKFLK